MRRRLALALVACALALAVGLAAGATTVDTFTTDTDFQDAQSLDNLTVVGSGTSASLSLEGTTRTTSRGGDTQSLSTSNSAGLVINPNLDIDETTVTMSSQTSGATTAYLQDGNGNGLETSSISNGEATFTTDLTAGTTYRVVVDAGGGSYQLGYDGSPSYPYTGTNVDITGDVLLGGTGNNEAYAISDVETTAEGSSGEYVSKAFAGDELDSGTAVVDPGTGTIDVIWEHDDDGDGNWAQITSASLTSAGSNTQSFANTHDTVRVRADFQPASGTTSMTLDSASVAFTSSSPTVDNAQASPQGRPFLTGQTVTLSIPVDDADLSTQQGDTLTATWYINNSQVAQTTHSSAGTISTDVGGIAGTNEWHVEVSDSYGNSVTSQSFQFKRPGKLEIRKETTPSELVTGTNTNPVEVEAQFYLGNDSSSAQQIITRTTTDGTIDMTGLPAGESFIAVATAEGYVQRRVFIESLGETQTIYLLNDTKQTVAKQYELQDFSGQYPGDETVLAVQRAIQGNWTTVTGDFFGASDTYTTTLEQNVRHRLVLRNIATGDRRIIGTVTPQASTTTTLTVQSEGNITLQRAGPFARISPSVGTLPAGDTPLDLAVRPGPADVARWNYSVRIIGGQTLASDSGLTGETASPTVNLTGYADERLRVTVGWTTAAGRTGETVREFAIAETYDNPSLLGGLATFPTLLPSGNGEAATTMIALLGTVLLSGTVATRYRVSSEGIGLTAVGVLALFSIIGWVSYAVTFAAAVAWTAMVALRRGL